MKIPSLIALPALVSALTIGIVPARAQGPRAVGATSSPEGVALGIFKLPALNGAPIFAILQGDLNKMNAERFAKRESRLVDADLAEHSANLFCRNQGWVAAAAWSTGLRVSPRDEKVSAACEEANSSWYDRTPDGTVCSTYVYSRTGYFAVDVVACTRDASLIGHAAAWALVYDKDPQSKTYAQLPKLDPSASSAKRPCGAAKEVPELLDLRKNAKVFHKDEDHKFGTGTVRVVCDNGTAAVSFEKRGGAVWVGPATALVLLKDAR
jgi:hypothetical protein